MMRRLRIGLPLLLAAVLAACNSDERQLLAQAEALRREGNFEGAVRLNTLLYERNRHGKFAAAALLNLGNINYLNLRQIRNAIEAYEKLIDHAPGRWEEYEARKRLAQIYDNETGDLTQAIVQYDKLLEWEDLDNRAEVQLQRANAYFKKEDYHRALRGLREIEEAGVSGHLADMVYLKIGSIYQIQHKFEDASVYFQRVAVAPCRECRRQAILDLVETYESLYDYDRAIEIIRKLDPSPENQRIIAEEIDRLSRQRRRVDSGPVLTWGTHSR